MCPAAMPVAQQSCVLTTSLVAIGPSSVKCLILLWSIMREGGQRRSNVHREIQAWWNLKEDQARSALPVCEQQNVTSNKGCVHQTRPSHKSRLVLPVCEHQHHAPSKTLTPVTRAW
eukprot:1160121-Pelagomonas_calceolata.AAC.7